MTADLHIHTYYSDGLNSPTEVVNLAVNNRLTAIALTDHDSVAGIDEALEIANNHGLIVIPGIEISTVNEGQDIHILGYYIDYKNPKLLEKLHDLRSAKINRNLRIINRLNQLGIEITIDEVNSKAMAANVRIGRPHIAQVLVEKKYVKNIREAYIRFLGEQGQAYIVTESISPEAGIDLVKEAGGASVLAHPGIYNDDALLFRLIEYGLDGIEVYHPDHNVQTINTLRKIAKAHSLIITGGSDYHGLRDYTPFHAALGSYNVPLANLKLLEELTNTRKKDLIR